MDVRNLSAILFDADNTLFDFDRAQRESLLEALGVSAIHPMAEEYVQRFKLINERAWRESEEGLLDKENVKAERFRRLKAEIAYGFDPETVSSSFLDLLSAKDYLLPGALETVDELKRQGIKIGLATNGFSAIQRGRLSRSPLAHCFDGIFISEELGRQKPNPEFFRLCLEGLGVPAPECIMVGDSPTADIVGAKAAGLFAVWINRNGAPYPGALPQPDIEIPMVGELPRVLGIGL